MRHDTENSFSPNTFKLQVVEDERRNPNYFEFWDQRSRLSLALCIYLSTIPQKNQADRMIMTIHELLMIKLFITKNDKLY